MLPVKTDPRVEAASILCRLAGLPQYDQTDFQDYKDAVDRHFKPYANHPSVVWWRRLSAEKQLGYSHPLQVALSLDQQSFAMRASLDPQPSWLGSNWSGSDARGFAEALARFVRDTDFFAFYSSTEGIRQRVETEYRDALAEGIDLDWFRLQYQITSETHLQAVPALLSRRASYGVHVELDSGGTEAFQVLATVRRPPPAIIEGLLIHELAHPFVNPWVDAHWGHLESSAERLFDPVEEKMKAQAYTTSRIMMYETLVRAMVIRYARGHGRTQVEQHAIEESRRKGFTWVPDLATALDIEPAMPLSESLSRVALFLQEWRARSRP